MTKNSTKVRKGIGRKIQTKQFESLEVTVAYEDTISWDDVEDRQTKLDKLSELALIDFEKTFGRICEDIGVSPRTGTATFKEEDGSIKTAAVPTENDNKSPKPMNDDDLDDFFDGV